MHLDVIDLRDFYGRPLGRVARRLVGRAVRACWPDVSGMTVAGLGYATPYLGQFRDEAGRVLALMPAQQGVVHWPRDGKYLTGLVDEVCLPLPDSSADRLLLVHQLEAADQMRPALREAWRVLAPGGRILIVAPNRRGMWARGEGTPFGHGTPFSRGQLVALLRSAMFTPVEWSSALFMPPIGWRFFLRSAVAWERVGSALWPRFSGVILVEATKQIYAPTGHRERARRRLPLVAPARIPASAREAGFSGHDVTPSCPAAGARIP
ncbi:methyltransferase domain-containing protein [Pyruvatibacter sp.]|uniref:methyltransferase domain-containing protein n=1 Tax=Pyruvatibacter sp. TaxID=1981328 RepID=UPI0032EB6704